MRGRQQVGSMLWIDACGGAGAAAPVTTMRLSEWDQVTRRGDVEAAFRDSVLQQMALELALAVQAQVVAERILRGARPTTGDRNSEWGALEPPPVHPNCRCVLLQERIQPSGVQFTIQVGGDLVCDDRRPVRPAGPTGSVDPQRSASSCK